MFRATKITLIVVGFLIWSVVVVPTAYNWYRYETDPLFRAYIELKSEREIERASQVLERLEETEDAQRDP